MSEIESRLYDQFNLKISEVKVLLADSGEKKVLSEAEVSFKFYLSESGVEVKVLRIF